MHRPTKLITRRDFIRTGSCVAMGSLLGAPMIAQPADAATGKSRVVLIRDAKIFNLLGSIRRDRMEAMLDEAVKVLFDEPDASSAWRKVIRPGDIVGIKSNVWGPLATPAVLERAIINRAVAVGVSDRNIGVDDRGVRRNPVFKRSTALINVRPMRTHHWSGLGTLIKNYVMFVPDPWAYHGRACESLGLIWKRLNLRRKTRLNILVMLTPLFHGIGPHHFSKRYLWPYRGLIVSTDPVAADVVGARIIQAKRNEFFNKYRPISPPPRHIEVADKKFALGNSHPERIKLIKLGWDKDSLI
ncbi:MAG: DUF362 domain-containing protein [Deltaproteobacteria bacterium]|nr:DUF362 domain-containing protein [Deltaproteobacteria bacterium]MBW1961538.1 DUF362 domain-containing protein [Deltaproteobacteria bacterium]MBW1994792.1 DUF362 domain-containing protein [Deltaproteobacteria bacterium]MBW2152238.1 DUF362 domain-containing protein [Deltaproteobacteria bacterium]